MKNLTSVQRRILNEMDKDLRRSELRARNQQDPESVMNYLNQMRRTRGDQVQKFDPSQAEKLKNLGGVNVEVWQGDDIIGRVNHVAPPDLGEIIFKIFWGEYSRLRAPIHGYNAMNWNVNDVEIDEISGEPTSGTAMVLVDMLYDLDVSNDTKVMVNNQPANWKRLMRPYIDQINQYVHINHGWEDAINPDMFYVELDQWN